MIVKAIKVVIQIFLHLRIKSICYANQSANEYGVYVFLYLFFFLFNFVGYVFENFCCFCCFLFIAVYEGMQGKGKLKKKEV